jgi:hypothetical protein
MKKIYGITLLIFLLTVCLCFSASDQGHAPPIPPDIAIESPDQSLPAQAKLLLGKWAGRWSGWKSTLGWDTELYVERVEKDSARVVFAWGEYNTRLGSCHCDPNWVRVQNAKIRYSDSSATLEFYTPKLRPSWLKRSHTVTGSADEVFGAHGKSSGRYSYKFVIDKDDPAVLKGNFVSAGNSPLSVKMKKIEQDKKSE